MWTTSVIVFTIFILAQNVNGIYDCEDCGDALGGGFQMIYHLLQKSLPMELKMSAPCRSCNITKAVLRKVPGDVCPVDHLDGSTTADLTVIFPTIEVRCDCSLSSNPTKLLSIASSTGLAANCTAEQAPTAGSNPVPTGPPVVNPLDLQKFPDCAQLVSVPGVSQIMQPVQDAEYQGFVQLSWPNMQINLTSFWTTNAKNPKVTFKNLRIISNDYQNINVQCAGSVDFNKSCKCLTATQYTYYILVQVAQDLFACDINHSPATADALTTLYCKPVL